jgi:hypothetical protein
VATPIKFLYYLFSFIKLIFIKFFQNKKGECSSRNDGDDKGFNDLNRNQEPNDKYRYSEADKKAMLHYFNKYPNRKMTQDDLEKECIQNFMAKAQLFNSVLPTRSAGTNVRKTMVMKSFFLSESFDKGT